MLEGDKLYCRSYLLDENGLVLGTQDLLHRSPLEKALGVVPGEEIRVFDTKAGRVAILIGQDGRTLEPLRIARGMGAFSYTQLGRRKPPWRGAGWLGSGTRSPPR